MENLNLTPEEKKQILAQREAALTEEQKEKNKTIEAAKESVASEIAGIEKHNKLVGEFWHQVLASGEEALKYFGLDTGEVKCETYSWHKKKLTEEELAEIETTVTKKWIVVRTGRQLEKERRETVGRLKSRKIAIELPYEISNSYSRKYQFSTALKKLKEHKEGLERQYENTVALANAGDKIMQELQAKYPDATITKKSEYRGRRTHYVVQLIRVQFKGGSEVTLRYYKDGSYSLDSKRDAKTAKWDADQWMDCFAE